MSEDLKNKTIAEIFKDEDFDSYEEDFVPREEAELDAALNEIADLKESMNLAGGPIPYPASKNVDNDYGKSASWGKTITQEIPAQQPPVQPPVPPTNQHTINYIPYPTPVMSYPYPQSRNYDDDIRALREETVRSVRQSTNEIISSIDKSRQKSSEQALDEVLGSLAEIKTAMVSKVNKEEEKPVVQTINLEPILRGIKSTEDAIKDLRQAVADNAKNTQDYTYNNDENGGDTAVLRNILALKKLIGADSIADAQLNAELEALFSECSKAESIVESTESSISKKLYAIDTLVDKVKCSYNHDVGVIVARINSLYRTIEKIPLDRSKLASLYEYLRKNGLVDKLLVSVRDAENYIDGCDRYAGKSFETYVDAIETLIERKNRIQGDIYKADYDIAYSQIRNLAKSASTERNKDTANALRNKAYAVASKILPITVGDVYVFDSISISKEYRTSGTLDGKTLFDYVLEIKTELENVKVDQKSAPVQKESPAVANLPEIVAQFDALFEDIKHVIELTETSINENLSVINDNFNVVKEGIDRVSVSTQTANLTLAEEVAFIKEKVSEYNPQLQPAGISEEQYNLLVEKIDAITAMQQAQAERQPEVVEVKPEITPEQEKSLNDLADIKNSQEATTQKISDVNDGVDFIKSILEEQKNIIKDSFELVSALKSEIASLKEDVKLQSEVNAQLKAEVEALKIELSEKVEPPVVKEKVQSSIGELKKELKTLNTKVVSKAKEVNDLDLDDILGKIDQAIADKSK